MRTTEDRTDAMSRSSKVATSPVHVVCADRVVTGAGVDVAAVAISGEVVVAAGSRAELTHAFPDATSTDYGDATVVAGFNDAHAHPTMMALQLLGTDLSPESVPDCTAFDDRLRSAIGTARRGDWVRGYRYDHVRSTGGDIVTRADLDALSADVPIVVTHVGAHWGVVNSAALRAAGLIDSDGVARRDLDPLYGCDEAGRLTGHLSEQALFDFTYPSLSRTRSLAPTLDGDEVLGAAGRAVGTFLRAGVTSICDAMVGPEELRLLQRLRADGRLDVRITALMTYPHIAVLRAAGIEAGFGDRWLRIGGIKAFLDGAVAGRSCAVAEPFEGTDDRGVLTSSRAEFTELVLEAQDAGFPVAAHANGERAIAMALDGFEAAAPGNRLRLRHRIEHCSVLTADLVQRMVDLDIAAVPFAGYPGYHGDALLAWYGADRLERMFAHRTLLDAGLTVAGSSDHPCGPLPPLAGLQSLVRRLSPAGRPVGTSQRITLREALALYTAGSARATGEDDVKGRLTPGRLADFTVLAGDLVESDASTIADLPVLATWVGGQCRWAAEPVESGVGQ